MNTPNVASLKHADSTIEEQPDTVRAEAKAHLKEHGVDGWALRSCWNCNGAHEYLKKATCVILCPWCDRWFYKGVDVTDYE